MLPGFTASDESTALLRGYVRARNFDARPWGLGRNRGPRAIGRQGVLDGLLESVFRDAGRKVSLVGWSLGGVYARTLANTRSHEVL